MMKDNWFDKLKLRYKLLIFVVIMTVFSWIIVVDDTRIRQGEELKYLATQVKVIQKQIPNPIPEHKKWKK